MPVEYQFVHLIAAIVTAIIAIAATVAIVMAVTERSAALTISALCSIPLVGFFALYTAEFYGAWFATSLVLACIVIVLAYAAILRWNIKRESRIRKIERAVLGE